MLPQPTNTAIDWDAQVSLKLLVEAAPIALAVVDQDGTIRYVNAKLEALFGYDRDELLGKAVEVLMPPRFHQVHVQHRLGYMQEPHVRTMGSGQDLAGRRKDGTEFPLEAGLSHLQVGDNRVVITTITDISRRKQIEEMLERRVEERTHEIERRRQVAEGLRAILATLNSSRSLAEILDFIARQTCWLLQADACAIYGRDGHPSRLTVQAICGLTPSESAQADKILARALLRTGAITVAIGDQVRPLGDAWLVEATDSVAPPQPTQLIVPLNVRGDLYGAIVIGYHTPHSFSNEDAELAMSVADQTALAIENARLSTQIEQTAVAAERNRIARDLHDAVTQTLFSASMIADVLPRIWQRNQAEGERRLSELRELTRGALAEMRTLLLELRPNKLIEVGMSDLLRQLAEGIAGRARVAVSVHIEGESEMPADVKVALYRIAQEALNNVAKHAQASQAAVHLHSTPTMIELTVTDDGRGFVFDHIRPEHLGLGIMRERADAIGATLAVHSQPDQGATVTARWLKGNAATS
jgi:PAS domain S-box-containing protein